jgi:hypothetical protein
VDVRVRARSIASVLEQEAVDEAAGKPPAEGARQRRRSLFGQRGAMRWVRSRRRRAEKPGPDLGCARASGEDGGDGSAVADTSSGDERRVELGRHKAYERQEAEPLGIVGLGAGRDGAEVLAILSAHG